MINSPLVASLAILAIVGVLCYAISKGFDGALLTSGIALIAGLGGYEVGLLKRKK